MGSFYCERKKLIGFMRVVLLLYSLMVCLLKFGGVEQDSIQYNDVGLLCLYQVDCAPV